MFDARSILLVALITALAGLGLLGCSGESATPREPGPPRIVVTIAPVAGLVEELVGDEAEVTTLLSGGASPHGYEMSPEDVRALGRADLIVAVGLGLEPWLERRLRSAPQLARKAVSFADLVGIEANAHDHAHHHGHSHDHDHEHCASGSDPHLWLVPELCSTFIAALPEQLPEGLAESAGARVAEVTARLNEIDAAYTERLSAFAGESIVTHHAAFQRLADAYGLEIADVVRAVESSEPTPAEIARTTAAIRERNAKAIFIEPQFNGAAAERLAEAAGVRLGRLDPLGTGDWFAMMRSNLDELVRTLGGAATVSP